MRPPAVCSSYAVSASCPSIPGTQFLQQADPASAGNLGLQGHFHWDVATRHFTLVRPIAHAETCIVKPL